MEKILLILFGLICGSFLNVVIHRLPRRRSVVRPRSRCPHCQRIIRFYDNIPLLSYLVLAGTCRYCDQPISLRYPLVEFITALSFLLSYLVFGHRPLYMAATFIFISLLICLAFIDLEHMILPDELTLGGTVVFLIYAPFHPEISLLNAFGSALGGAGVFALLYYFYLKVRKIEGLGFGDVKMMLLLGAFLGLNRLVMAVFIASIIGLLVGMFFILVRGKTMRFALPFGSFLSLGALVSLFTGDWLMSVLHSFYT